MTTESSDIENINSRGVRYVGCMTQDHTRIENGALCQWLTETQAAERLSMSVKYLQKCRYSGGGPPYAKFGSAVRYSIADLETFERASLQDNTSMRSSIRRDG